MGELRDYTVVDGYECCNDCIKRENALGGNVSVWNRGSFAAKSPNQNIDLTRGNVTYNRSAFRSGGWIGFKSVK